MLSFDTALSTALKLGNTTAFWVLKLYYNDDTTATNYTGVSDIHRKDNRDIYYGLVSSWGNYHQSLNFFDFSTTTGNMTIKLVNTEKSIQGGRFSDLLASNNYANRKWELFLNTSHAGAYDTAARMIGTGIISGDIDYDTRFLKFILLDMTSKYYGTIPRTTVNSTDHPNAPDTNFGKPVPISYGDFWEKETIGTILTTNFDRFHQFYKGVFPAIVTDKWNATSSRIEASCDILSLTTLDADNIYGHFKDSYGQCETTTKDQPSAKITATGDDWRLYVPLLSHATYASGGGSAWTNYANTFDNKFDGNYVTFTATGGAVAVIGWRLPKVEKLGTLTSVHLLMSFSNGSGSPSAGFTVKEVGTAGGGITQTIVASGGNMSDADGEKIEAITGIYDGTDAAEWDLEDDIFLVLDDTGGSGAQSIRIYEVGVMIVFKQEEGLNVRLNQINEYNTTRTVDVNYGKSDSAGTVVNAKRTIASTRDAIVPAISSYLFYNGKGRKSGAWIDTDTAGSTARVNGLNKGNEIESPIYIIEDILRTECGTITKGTANVNLSNNLKDTINDQFTASMVGQTAYNLTDGTSAFVTAFVDAETLTLGADVFDNGNENYYICGLTDDEIDTGTFDSAGNTASSAGDVYNALGGAASTSEWAFAQAKFTGSRDLIYRISRQCGAYVFISGDGKIKIKVLRQSGHSENKEVDFNDIDLKEIKLTSLNNVRNSFIINYNKDYAADQYQDKVTESDATSQGSGATGYNQELTLEMNADVVSSTTADQIADMYKAFFKDRHIMMSFDCLRPYYNDLEISDIIKFTNWDTNIKIYGTAMGTDYYIVQDISKSVNGCSITAIKVS